MLLLRYWPVCASSLVLVLAGCGGGGPPGAKPTKPVSVTLTYKGAPLEGATVSFINESNPAYGRTDAAGIAKMKTYVEGDGAVVGSYKVTVNKAESAPDTNADVSTEAYNPNAATPEIKNLIPLKYSSPATSGLTHEVKENGPNDVTFELVD